MIKKCITHKDLLELAVEELLDYFTWTYVYYIDKDDVNNGDDDPYLLISTSSSQPFNKVTEWLNKRTYLKDLLKTECISQWPNVYIKVKLKAPKNKFYFWYGYIRMNRTK